VGRASNDALRRFADDVAASSDPVHALRALVSMRLEIEEATRDQVRRGLEAGRSFGELAGAMGISRQAAHRRYRHLAPAAATVRPARARLATTSEAAAVLHAACDEAVRAGADTLGTEHLLLALLRCGGDLRIRLEEVGVTLEGARELLRPTRVARRRPPRDKMRLGGVRAVLLEAIHIAATRGENTVDVDALLLAAIDHPDGGARGLLTALGVHVPSLPSRLGLTTTR
jgi:hypothetical protein